MLKSFLSIIFFQFIILFSAPSFSENNHSFDKYIEDIIFEKLGDDKLEIKIDYDLPDRAKRIAADQANIKDITLNNIDQLNKKFKVKVNYINAASEELTGHYTILISVPMSNRLIKMGEIIKASDLQYNTVKARLLKNNYITSEIEIIGMQAKKNIPAGNLFRSIDIAKIPVIKNNDPVNLVYLTGNMELKTVGIALGAGSIGDTVKVKNEDTGVVVLGQIINKNTVQVGGE